MRPLAGPTPARRVTPPAVVSRSNEWNCSEINVGGARILLLRFLRYYNRSVHFRRETVLLRPVESASSRKSSASASRPSRNLLVSSDLS